MNNSTSFTDSINFYQLNMPNYSLLNIFINTYSYDISVAVLALKNLFYFLL